MKPGKRFGLSAEQKLDVWHRWKAGQTLHEIGRAFGKEHSSIRGLVAPPAKAGPANGSLALSGIGATAERPTRAAKDQKEFTPALLRSASGELLPS